MNSGFAASLALAIVVYFARMYPQSIRKPKLI